ncbi:MAG: LptF/LptG family permease [Candidatus Sericytochromatia bacterium]|nr:LptF/LptG family permease [Candidatus Sericytochromatia bacterium]
MTIRAMLKILDRYILLELVNPFLFGVFGFLIVMLPALMFNLTDLIIKAGAPLRAVSKLFLYNLPFLTVLAFPVAFLFATLLAIGRMTKDFEVIAMRSAGISLKRIITPIMLTSLGVCGAAFVLNETVVPYANKQINQTIQDMTRNLARPPIKENTFFQGTDNRYFYIKEVRSDGQMKDIFIFDKTKDGLPQVIQAERARWVGQVWRLEFGTNYRYDRDGYIENEIAFKTMDIAISLNTSELIPPGLNAQEMSTAQLQGQISDLRKTGGATRQIEVQYWKKWSLPLASFFAALIAAPLGLIFSRMGGYVGVAFSIILVFIYYVTLQITEALGNFGHIPPFFGAWTSNLIFLLVGSVLVWRMDLR